MKPHIHAENSAKKFGGKPEDYLDIHVLMDSSKAALCDCRHRILTHNAWFIGFILEKIFGNTIVNSDGGRVSVRDIGEQHVSEDYRSDFVPSLQDWVLNLPVEEWMKGSKPPANRNLSVTPELPLNWPNAPQLVPHPGSPIPFPHQPPAPLPPWNTHTIID